MSDHEYLTVEECADKLRLHHKTIYKLIEEQRGVGALFVRTPKLVVSCRDLTDWIEQGCPE